MSIDLVTTLEDCLLYFAVASWLGRNADEKASFLTGSC